MMRLALSLLLMLFVNHPLALWAMPLNAIRDNNLGAFYLQNKAQYQAYQKFAQALSHDPFNPVLHLNLALSFALNEEYDKALQSLNTALTLATNNTELQFAIYFDLAEVHVKQSRIDQALDAYQKALAIKPDSVEVKTNIELLWQNQNGKGQGQGQQNSQQQQNQNQDQNQDQKQDQKQDQNPNQNQNQQEEKKPEKPKPFQGQKLTEQDMKKILEEIKNQEQAIRAQEYQKGTKEAPHGKDW